MTKRNRKYPSWILCQRAFIAVTNHCVLVLRSICWFYIDFINIPSTASAASFIPWWCKIDRKLVELKKKRTASSIILMFVWKIFLISFFSSRLDLIVPKIICTNLNYEYDKYHSYILHEFSYEFRFSKLHAFTYNCI